MNSRRESSMLVMMIGVTMLFGLSAIGLDRGQSPTAARLGETETGGRKHKKPGESNPGGALRFQHLQMQDEKGFIPPDGLEKARQHVAQMRRAPLGTVKPDTWSWLGPGNVGGRIRSIVIQSNNPNNIWVGSVTGGIWRTVNGGASWTVVNDFLANLAVSTMVINPVTNMMYAGTGEGLWPVIGQNSYIDAVQGGGIYASPDGVTWNLLGSTNPTAPPIPGCGVGSTPCSAFWLFVNRLAISPDGITILAATNGGIAQSTNGGTSWTQRTSTQAADVEFRPGDSTRAMIGELGAARFTLDGGQTWTAATFSNPPVTSGGRIELATSPVNASIVYAAVNQNNGEIYRSNDGGQTYTRVNTGNSFFNAGAGNQGDYDNVLWLNPQDPDTLIVGGIHLWRGTYNQITQTVPLVQISDGSANSSHADHHIIVPHPGFNNTSNRIAYFGNDGGIFRADDISAVAQTSGWTELNNNLGITQFYGAAGNAATGVIVGGAQDNGTQRFTGNPEGWTSMQGSDGGYCAADPTDSNFFYGETQYLGVVRSTDGGQSSSSISAGITDAGNQNLTNFVAPLVLDPNDPNTFLAGGLNFWRSANVKASIPNWVMVPKPNPNNSLISAIVVSPVTSDLIVVAHNNGDIFRTFNGTSPSPVWTQIDPPALPARMVTRLTIDSTRSTNWIYATFGGFSADNVYRSTDNGTTWADITGTGATGLPNVPVRSLVFHPSNPNLLFVGTEIGIFTSDDAGATWEVPQNGPANVSVDELFWMGGDLIAATHGRGLYRASGGIYVDCNYNGIQLGTFDQPFKTVAAALDAAISYRTIWLKPCNYNETFPLINRRVELRSLGGVAKIGSGN